MKRLLCLLGFHDWKMSRFKALNATSFNPDFICQRCRKFKSGDDA